MSIDLDEASRAVVSAVEGHIAATAEIQTASVLPILARLVREAQIRVLEEMAAKVCFCEGKAQQCGPVNRLHARIAVLREGPVDRL